MVMYNRVKQLTEQCMGGLLLMKEIYLYVPTPRRGETWA
jgi:hypothetical protein